MKIALQITRDSLCIRQYNSAIKTQTGIPPKKRQTEALAALLKQLKTN